MRKKIQLPLDVVLPIAGVLSILVSVAYHAYGSMCLGENGTRYFMTGEAAHPLVASCAVYDYSKFHPGFESKTDSFRTFR